MPIITPTLYLQYLPMGMEIPGFRTNMGLTSFTAANNGTWFGGNSYATVKVSVANPDVVWAGSAVSGGTGTTYKINVSKDNGATFTKTTGSMPTTGSYYISGISASNTTESRAYVLFSVADQPKVVKQMTLGQPGQIFQDTASDQHQQDSRMFPYIA